MSEIKKEHYQAIIDRINRVFDSASIENTLDLGDLRVSVRSHPMGYYLYIEGPICNNKTHYFCIDGTFSRQSSTDYNIFKSVEVMKKKLQSLSSDNETW